MNTINLILVLSMALLSNTQNATITSNTTALDSTSTVYATDTLTISSCAPTVTNCPYANHSTILTSSAISQIIYQTQLITITSCAPEVTDCPLRSTHSLVPVSTIPCPCHAKTTVPPPITAACTACQTLTVQGPTTYACPPDVTPPPDVSVKTISGTPHVVVPPNSAYTYTITTEAPPVTKGGGAAGNVSVAATAKPTVPASGAGGLVVGVWGTVGVVVVGLLFLWA